MSSLSLMLFSMLDSKVGTFSPPFHAPSRAAAIRIVRDAMADQNSMLGRHPKDYSLHLVGVVNLETGVVEGVRPENLGVIETFLEEAVPSPLFRTVGGAS